MKDDKEPLFTDFEKELLDKHLAQISEHFDTVQIFVTKHTPATERTGGRVLGSGNWFARYGQIMEWVAGVEEGMHLEPE